MARMAPKDRKATLELRDYRDKQAPPVQMAQEATMQEIGQPLLTTLKD